MLTFMFDVFRRYYILNHLIHGERPIVQSAEHAKSRSCRPPNQRRSWRIDYQRRQIYRRCARGLGRSVACATNVRQSCWKQALRLVLFECEPSCCRLPNWGWRCDLWLDESQNPSEVLVLWDLTLPVCAGRLEPALFILSFTEEEWLGVRCRDVKCKPRKRWT